MPLVHRLGHTVGVGKEQVSPLQDTLILAVHQLLHRTDDRAVSVIEPDQLAVHPAYIGGIVTGVRVEQLPGIEVQNSEKNGDEHAGVVVTADLFVHVRKDAGRRIVVRSPRLDQGLGHGHEQRRWHSLARDITDAKTEVFVVDEEEVVEVATHFPGRLEHGEDIELAAPRVGRKDQGEHAHLDLPPDVQLVLHPVTGLVELCLHLLAFRDVSLDGDVVDDFSLIIAHRRDRHFFRVERAILTFVDYFAAPYVPVADRLPHVLVEGPVVNVRLQDLGILSHRLLEGITGQRRKRRINPQNLAIRVGDQDPIGGRIERCGLPAQERFGLLTLVDVDMSPDDTSRLVVVVAADDLATGQDPDPLARLRPGPQLRFVVRRPALHVIGPALLEPGKVLRVNHLRLEEPGASFEISGLISEHREPA